ncbi:MAG TPA: TonB-dependent receptor [Geobacteraceae bacterium]|nr:TonB-dependent receptor [Geobacteraceae bacterium]
MNTIKTFCIFCCALAVLVFFRTPALAAPDEDLQTLEMFYEGKDLAVSATRAPKPLSQTAENVTVVTAAEIEMMGAHTLTDVLNNVSGLQTNDYGSLATFAGVQIYGSDIEHVLVMQDGVVLNFLGAGLADIAAVPVQHIDRIEIIKGPGSSSWGSALGGVINVITKSPDEERKVGGGLSFSGGDRQTRDTRGEASGTVGPFGYYLDAGHLTSGGLRPHTALDTYNLFGKFRWNIRERGSVLLTLDYTKQTVEDGQFIPYSFDLRDRKRNFLGNVAFNYHLTDRADLDVSLRSTSKYFNDTIRDISVFPPAQLPDNLTRETTHGGSVKLTWRGGINAVAAGADFDHLDLNYEAAMTRFKSDQWGIFLNDTLTLGDFSLTPGVRFDRLHQTGNIVSPSLGATWQLDEKTILRLYAARGYSLPVLILGDRQEKVCTLQVGAETTRLPYVWFKTTLFLNYISDHQAYDVDGNLIFVKEKRQGVEAEAKTVPIFNTSLSAGYTFIDARNRETGETLVQVPRQIGKMGVHYDDRTSFRASFIGRYVWWNGSTGLGARDNAIIWDLNLAKKILRVHDTALELFFNAHNLFNGAQYPDEITKGTPRWLEGGARFNF